MLQFFYHIWWFPYFFLTFDGSNFILCSSNITFDSTIVIFGGSFFSFLTFDGFILTLCSTNITCDCIFVTFGGSFSFFSHLMVLFSHCATPILHMTILLSHLVVFFFFFFSYLIVLLSHSTVPTYHLPKSDYNALRT